MTVPPQVNTVFECLEKNGFQAFLVGGAVRDFIRNGSAGNDWDIATDALPRETKLCLSAYPIAETGLRHGTVTAVIDGLPVEITTYRVDGIYSDGRRPDTVSFSKSLIDDLSRRDFTMNAVAWHPVLGITDPFGGAEDIRGNLIRCVGAPERRFAEDSLRILRALRFASVYEMKIESAAADAAHACRELLAGISAERIMAELTKMLCGPGVSAVLRDFPDVLAAVIPEIEPMFGFEQRNPHHDRDVWEHTAAVVSAAPPSPVMRWAALFHDIGKPSCFSVDSEGTGHFYGHENKSALIADDVLRRLRCSTPERENILRLIRFHGSPLSPDRKTVLRMLRKHGADTARQLIQLHAADAAGQPEAFRGRIDRCREAEEILDGLLREEACFSLRDLAINGNDLTALGVRGKQTGIMLASALDAVVDGRVGNDKREILAFLFPDLAEKRDKSASAPKSRA